MKIVHIIDHFPTQARYQEYYLARHQAALGHNVTIITSDVEWDYARSRMRYVGGGTCLLDGFEVIRLRSLVRRRTVILCLSGLRACLERIGPDAVHVHGITYRVFPWQVAVYKRALGYRLVYDSHAAVYNTDTRSHWLKYLYNWFHVRLCTRAILDAADRIVAIGPDEKDFLCNELSLTGEQVAIIPLGVDCTLFRPDHNVRNAVRRRLGICSSEVLIIHTGKMKRTKQVHLLLEAIASLGAKAANTRILLIGNEAERGYKEYLSELAHQLHIAQKIIWLDFCDSSELAAYFAASDIAVWAGGPSISMLEAMGSGLPLVLGNWGQYAEQYVRAGNGVVFPQGSSSVLSDRLAQLMDRDLRVSMGRISRKVAQQTYSWDVITRRFIELYEPVRI